MYMKNTKQKKQTGHIPRILNKVRSIDFILLVIVLLLVTCGLIIAYGFTKSSSFDLSKLSYRADIWNSFYQKKIYGIVIGLFCMYVFSKLDYTIFYKCRSLFFFGTFIPLLLLLIPGTSESIGGARRWLLIGPLSFMPLYFVEISFVLFLSAIVNQIGKETFRDSLMKYLIIFVPPSLMFSQPDFMGAVLFVQIGLSILFVTGHRLRIFLIITMCTIPIFIRLLLAPYRLRRVISFLDPNLDPGGSGFQLVQSFIAFRSGGLSGVGFGKGTARFQVPNISNDFIFSLIGEEFGFAGSIIIISLFILFILRGQLISHRIEHPYGKMLALGLTYLIGFRAALHIGSVTGLIPTKGISLPFISFDNSSIIADFIIVGILLNISYSSGKYFSIYSTINPSKFLEAIKSKGDNFDKSFLYKLIAFAALLLTLIVSIIEIYKVMK